jgi:hypothetical protein
MAVSIDRLIRTSRKTVGLIVESDATLTVRAPRAMSRPEIERLVQRKHKWITRMQKIARERAQVVQGKRFTDGELHLFLGKRYPLVLEEGRPYLRFDGARFILAPSQAGRARDLFVQWYRKQSRDYFTRLASEHASRMGLRFKQVRVSGAKQRWASCGSTGNLNFSWRLVLAPEPIVDYVVVHELCHLVQPNHSAAFWNLVRSEIPDFRERRKWLKEKGPYLAL